MIKFIRQIKTWSTRKQTLWFAIAACLIYTLLDCLVTILNASTGSAVYFDSTLTTEFFSLMKWVVGLGGGLTATSIVSDTIGSLRNSPTNDVEEDETTYG